MTAAINTELHPLDDPAYAAQCHAQLHNHGALVLTGFIHPQTIDEIVTATSERESDAFYANSTHNVYLTPPDASLAADHPFNRQVLSTKGLIADNQIDGESPLRAIYGHETFRTFLCKVLGIDAIYPYADDVSSINVHFAAAGMELGWHFDNSSFAVTLLLRAPEAGGEFEFVPGVRNAEQGHQGFDRVAAVLDGEESVSTLDFEPGDLVLFRGRNALHRVTPTVGTVTRLLTVFAYNDEPGIKLSNSARRTFYGDA